MIFLFCAVIGIFLAGTYWAVYQMFVSEAQSCLDDRLLEASSLLKAEIASRFNGESVSPPELGSQFYERVGADGTVLERSASLNHVDLRLPPLPASSGRPVFRTLKTPEGTVRTIATPVVVRAERQWLVYGEPTRDTLAIEARFRERAFGMWTVSLLLTTMIAAWYVAKGLAPLVELNKHAALLTQEASRASRQDLRARLPVVNPNDELGLLSTNFNELFARLDAVVRQLRQFVSDAAHELRTPLSVLKGETQFLLAQPRGVDEYQRTLTTIDSELTVMVQIVEGLFTLSMADAGQLRPAREALRLDEVLEEAVGIAAPSARKRKILILLEAVAEVEFWGDPILLRQVLLILLENAIKYSPEQTTIHVGIVRQERDAEIFVRDEGMGIRSGDLPHIFQRFYRAASAQPNEPRGGGLGLAIAEAIMRAHGGDVHCASDVGKGSTFILRFPAP